MMLISVENFFVPFIAYIIGIIIIVIIIVAPEMESIAGHKTDKASETKFSFD
jgi:hypothetical protein